MIVCHCTQATDRTVCAAAAAGCKTADEVAVLCEAGAHCGGCRPLVQEILDEAHALQRRATRNDADDRRVRLSIFVSDAHVS